MGVVRGSLHKLTVLPPTRFQYSYLNLRQMLFACGLLLLIFFKSKNRGTVTCSYLLLHGAVRFFTEYSRLDQPTVGVLTHAQIISLILVVIALLGFFKMKVLKNA